MNPKLKVGGTDKSETQLRMNNVLESKYVVERKVEAKLSKSLK